MEPIQSPKKKSKNIKSRQDRKQRAAERLQSMSIRERCLMVECVIYAEEEFENLPIEYQDMWEFMDKVSKYEKVALLARKEGTFSQGGGGWPSTATMSP